MAAAIGEAAEEEAATGDKSRSIRRTPEKESIMPRGDGTGPEGLGPMTGRGAGTCKGSEAARSRRAPPDREPRRGGFGRGGGRGRRKGGPRALRERGTVMER